MLVWFPSSGGSRWARASPVSVGGGQYMAQTFAARLCYQASDSRLGRGVCHLCRTTSDSGGAGGGGEEGGAAKGRHSGHLRGTMATPGGHRGTCKAGRGASSLSGALVGPSLLQAPPGPWALPCSETSVPFQLAPRAAPRLSVPPGSKPSAGTGQLSAPHSPHLFDSGLPAGWLPPGCLLVPQ